MWAGGVKALGRFSPWLAFAFALPAARQLWRQRLLLHRPARHRQMGSLPCLACYTFLVTTHVYGANDASAAPTAPKAEEQLTFLEAEPQPSPHSPGRIAKMHDSEESASAATPWPDPEELTSLSVKKLKELIAPLQSPTPLASPEPKPAAASRPTEEMLRTHRGVLLSAPLSMDEKAKAMTEMATTMCTNTCASSHDGVCSDGASKTFCTGAEAFPPAGRGECAAAEGSECELGTDCAPLPTPAQPTNPPHRSSSRLTLRFNPIVLRLCRLGLRGASGHRQIACSHPRLVPRRASYLRVLWRHLSRRPRRELPHGAPVGAQGLVVPRLRPACGIRRILQPCRVQLSAGCEHTDLSRATTAVQLDDEDLRVLPLPRRAGRLPVRVEYPWHPHGLLP